MKNETVKNETVNNEARHAAINPTSRWTALREQLRQRHSVRTGRRALERQLASYSTEAQISELEAIFSRYEGADVAELRTIVQRARAAA